MSAVVCQKGYKGRFKASGLQFEIVETTSSTSTIRIRENGEVAEVRDDDLKASAEGIDHFV